MRRHFDALAEGLRADVRLVAEGVSATQGGLRELRGEMKEELTELRSMIGPAPP